MPHPAYLNRDQTTGLTEHERRCLEILKVEGGSRADVMAELGVSRQRVSQLVKAIQGKGHTVPSRQYNRRTPKGGTNDGDS